ncbi:hypothetical protein BDF14DRAFT_1811906 [Spinellus fusiger]|nr:hypothetical protein BDF14DRAFT_1811906 [Spinellus fusiger]
MATTGFGSAYSKRAKTIEVPLQHEQVLEVVCNDLPGNPTELTDIFRQEGVALPYYRMLAIEYYEQEKIEESIAVVEAALATASHSPQTQPRQKLPLLTLIATLNLRLARKAESSEKQKYMSAATQYINEADRIHNQYEQTFVVKGNYHLLRRDVNEASRAFSMLLDKRPNCIPALLGRAKIQYHLKQYKQSLKTYQSALLYSRGKFAGAEIRLGIAQCYAQLGMYEETKVALQRTIELSEKPNATALIMLAIVELNESKKLDQGALQQENALRNGLQHMKTAHTADKKHPVVLNMLANYFFLTRDFEKTVKSASKAMGVASNNIIKAESSYQIGRAHHQMQEFNDAFKFYRQCLDLNPEHTLAQYSVGQIYLKRGEYDLAIQIFEKLYETEPQCVEVMKVLGSLYAIAEKKPQALILFNKALEIEDNDASLAVEIAQLYDESDSARALKYYEQALALMDKEVKKKDEPSQRVEVLNNIATMHHILGHLDEAEHCYGLAITESEKATSAEPSSPEEKENAAGLRLTITYNLARLYEDRLETYKATAIYKKIADDYPAYIDAHLRLGAIEQSMGRAVEAQEHYKEVFDTDPNDAVGWIMIGQAQATINEKLCKRSFEKVLKDCDRNDLYTHIALGNYHAAAARELKNEKVRNQRTESYKLAVNFYQQALKRDPQNAYAANGLAITLAENGHIEHAKDIFNQVRESTASNPCVWLNLAHTFVELKQYRQAIVLYENTSKKFFNNTDANLLLCLARAQYILAKAEKDPEIMFSSLQNTQKAFHIAPSDKSTLYNIALVQQLYAQLISDLPKDQRASRDMRRAMNGLDSSQNIFRMLIHVPAEEFVLYDRKITEQRERYGETLRMQLERKMLEQIQYEEDKQRKIDEVRVKREEDLVKKKAEEAKKLQKIEEERVKMDEERRKLMARVYEENLQMAAREVEEDELEAERKTKKRARKRKEIEEEEEEEEETRRASDEDEDNDNDNEQDRKRRDRKVFT